MEKQCKESPEYVLLRETVEAGFPQDKSQWCQTLRQFSKVYKELSTLGQVVMLNNRIVLPKQLRAVVLQHLHACHSGTSARLQRALTDVYWPNYASDVVQYRANCASCNIHAPSNPYSTPEPDLPQYPFQVVCTDFFTHHDKYSNWLSIIKLQKDDSRHVIKALRGYFSMFGYAKLYFLIGLASLRLLKLRNFASYGGYTSVSALRITHPQIKGIGVDRGKKCKENHS